MRRWSAVLASLALISGAASAASVGSASATAPARSTAVSLPESIDYVALGDSYTAGPFIPTQRTDPTGCLRSTNNYPAYLASYLGAATYVDVSCSGARTLNLFQPQTLIFGGGTTPPQLDVLSEDTDLVTVGIGGNDFGLFGDLITVCPGLRDQDPEGHPCKDQFTNSQGVDTKLRDAANIEVHVAKAVRRVQLAAPHAEVFFVGYPRLLPKVGTCELAPFATRDYNWARRIQRTLNASIRDAALANGARYVNLFGVTEGHDICAGAEAWINGRYSDPTRALYYHPLQAGMEGEARQIYSTITGLPAPAAG